MNDHDQKFNDSNLSEIKIDMSHLFIKLNNSKHICTFSS